MESVMDALRQRRNKLGVSQRELAARTGLPQPTIAAYESGIREPGIANAGRIATGLATKLALAPLADVERIVTENVDLRRGHLHSLLLAHQIVIEFLVDPQRVLNIGRARLVELRAKHRRSRPWFDAWERLLDGPGHELIAALIDPSCDAADLRQSAPFAGVVDQDTRALLLEHLHTIRRDRRHAS